MPSLEVVLVEQVEPGRWQTPSWLPDSAGGLPVPTDRRPADDVAETLMSCVLRLPVGLSRPLSEDALWQVTPQAWQDSKLLHRLPALVVDGAGMGAVGDQSVRYTKEFGLEVVQS